MTTEAELLAQVYAAPDEDGPRLVYADWLQEHGDALRGELITLQIERARGKARSGGRKRENELLEEHAIEWARPLGLKEPTVSSGYADSDHHIGEGCTFERGFPERVVARTYGLDPAWSLIRTCNIPPANDACHTTMLRSIEHARTRDIIALSPLTRPLPIEQLAWGHVCDPDRSSQESLKPTITPEAIDAFRRIAVLPRLRRLELSPSIVGQEPAPSTLAWTWETQPISELLVPGDGASLAAWLALIAKSQLVRFELVCPALGYGLWQMGMRIVVERDEARRWSRLTALIKRSTRTCLEALAGALTRLPADALTSMRVAVAAKAEWDKTAAQRAALAKVIDRIRVESVIEKASR